LTALRADDAAAGPGERVPEHGRNASQRVAPAGGPGQVIDRYLGVPIERREARGRSVPPAKDAAEIRAIIEGEPADAAKAFGDADASQKVALLKNIVAEAREPAGNTEAGQADTLFKCARSDVGIAAPVRL